MNKKELIDSDDLDFSYIDKTESLYKISQLLEFCLIQSWKLSSKKVQSKILKCDEQYISQCFNSSTLFFAEYLERLNDAGRWADYADFYAEYYESTKDLADYAEVWASVNVRYIVHQLKKLQEAEFDIGSAGYLTDKELYLCAIEAYTIVSKRNKKSVIKRYRSLSRAQKYVTCGIAAYFVLYVSSCIFINI